MFYHALQRELWSEESYETLNFKRQQKIKECDGIII